MRKAQKTLAEAFQPCKTVTHTDGKPSTLEGGCELPEVTENFEGNPWSLLSLPSACGGLEERRYLLWLSPTRNTVLEVQLIHPNGCCDLPRCLWAFGCVGMLGLSYGLGNLGLSSSSRKDGLILLIMPLLSWGVFHSVASIMLSNR